MEIPGVGNNFLIILEREGFNDLMVIKVEVQKSFCRDSNSLKRCDEESRRS